MTTEHGRFDALPEGEEPYTGRGFEFYANFRDRYGSRVRVQQSSLATEPCVWIFADDNDQIPEPSPHLTADMARTVIEALEDFIKWAEG